MSNATADRRINLYINGKEVKNDIASIKKEMYKLVNEQSRMTRGSAEYVAHTRKIKTLKGMLSEHNASLRATGSTWTRLTRSVRNSWTTVLGFTAALGGSIAMVWKFINASINFKKELHSLKAITGLAGKELKWLGEEAKRLSVTTTKEGIRITKSATDILKAYKLAGSAKPELLKNKEALAEFTKEALILAKAADMETGPAVLSLAGIMNQYGESAKEARKYANALAAGQKAGSAFVDKIAESFENFGATAKNANIPVEQSVGLIETLAERSIFGAKAGTGLRNFLLILQQGADDTNPAIVGLNKALENLAAKQYTTNELYDIFGRENIEVAQILIDSTERVKYFTQAVTDTNSAYEQAIQNADERQDQLDQERNRANQLAITIGDKLQPAMLFSIKRYRELLNVTGRLIDWTTEHSKTLKVLAKILIIITSAVLSLKVGFFAANFAVKSYNQVVKIATTLTRLFNGALKVSPIGIITTLLTAATTAFFLFKGKVKETTEEYGDFNKKLEETERIINKKKIQQFLRDIGLLKKELKEVAPGTFIETETLDASLESIAKLKKAITNLSASELSGLKDVITSEIIEMKRDLDGVDLTGMLIGDIAEKAAELGTLQNSLQLINDELKKVSELDPTVTKKKKEKTSKKKTDQEIAYEKLQESIRKIREDMLLDGMSADQKEIEQLNAKYAELYALAEKGEGDIFEIEALYAKEREKLEQDQEERKLKAKQEAQQKLEEFYMSDFDKEKKTKIKQYQELIALAEKFGLTTTEYYQKLIDELEKLKTSTADEEADIFGMTPEKWEAFQENFENTLGHFDELASAYDAWSDLQSQKSDEELQDEQKKADAKKKILDDQLKKRIISQEEYDKKILAIDEAMEKKRAEADVEAAKRDKISSLFSIASDTARGIMESVAASPLTLGMPWSALIGVMGLLQSAAVMAQPLPEYAGGGYTDGDRIYRAGEKGTEWIATNQMVDDPFTGPIISNLESIRRGIMPKTTAKAIPDFTAAYDVSKTSPGGGLAYGSQPQAYPSGQSVDNNFKVLVDSNQILLEEMKKLTQFLSDPDNRRAYISYDLLKKYEKEMQNLQKLGRIS